MIRAAIVEDEYKQAEKLRSLLLRFSDEAHRSFAVEIFGSGFDFLENYHGNFDIVFLDIEMPGIDGLEVANRIREMDRSVLLVFATNMAQFAIKGYEVDAVGYLVKPVMYFALRMVLVRAIGRLKTKVSHDIVIKTRDGVRVVPSEEVEYVESVKHDVVFHTAADSFARRGTLKEVEEELKPFSFVRSNSCYLVNLCRVRSVANGMVELTGVSLPISRDRKKTILTAFMKYLGGGCNN